MKQVIDVKLAVEALREFLNRLESKEDIHLSVLEHQEYNYSKEINNVLTIKWSEKK